MNHRSRHPVQLHHRLIQFILKRHGLRGMLLTYVTVAVTSSVLATTILTILLWHMVSEAATIITMVVSASVSAPISYLHLRIIQELEQSRSEIRMLAITDGLTGIFNRRHFMELAEQAVADAIKQEAALSVILFDVDDFKQVNDTHGHHSGDELLRAICDTVKAMLRPTDVFARYGGEEFIVLLPSTGKDQARAIAESIRKQVSAVSVTRNDKPVRATISLGVITSPDHSYTLDALLVRADQAQYHAKNFGKNYVWMADWSVGSVMFGSDG